MVWEINPFWGAGLVVRAGEARALGSRGAYWMGNDFGPDHYSEIRMSGGIGAWQGVMVRGSGWGMDCYVAAVKPDGVYLYALMGGVFHELVHDAGNWQTGDRLRLEVATVDAGTARLAVYRNGGLVFSHDETEDLIGGGRPGLGIGSDPALALDDWRGGGLSVTP